PDLGLGREMHCTTYKVQELTGHACYVANYDGVGGDTPSFPTDPHNALSDAINTTRAIARVAMVYNPRAAQLGQPENSVQFIVYNAQGDRVNTAKLDSKGDNMSVPTNCLVCHGGSFTPDTDQVARQAHFLPFDVFRLKYADDLGIDAPEYTYNAQAEKFRKLNEHVYNAGATDDIKGMIDSMYGGPGKVSIANTPAQEY